MKKLILEVAKERVLSLRKEISRLKTKDYPSKSPVLMLDVLDEANDVLFAKIAHYENDPEELRFLEPARQEVVLKRFTRLIPYLYYFLNFIQGSDLEALAVEIIVPLRRLVKRYINNSDIIFVAKPELNFSFLEISEPFKRVFSGFDEFKTVCAKLPKFFLSISLPSVEKNSILLHAIIAHEFGHGIYQERKLGETLLPLIKVDKGAIGRLSKEIYDSLKSQLTGDQLPLLVPELVLRESISKQINIIIRNWVEEISADMMGLYLFGPAYFFASCRLNIPVAMMDSSSDTHPSPRTRLRVLSRCLRNLGYDKLMSARSAEVFTEWARYGEERPAIAGESRTAILAAEMIMPSLDSIEATVRERVKDLAYQNSSYANMPELCDRLANLIPANESMSSQGDGYSVVDVISVINAGWEVMLSRIEEFASNCNLEDPQSVREKLDELVLASIHRVEIRERWAEAARP